MKCIMSRLLFCGLLATALFYAGCDDEPLKGGEIVDENGNVWSDKP